MESCSLKQINKCSKFKYCRYVTFLDFLKTFIFLRASDINDTFLRFSEPRSAVALSASVFGRAPWSLCQATHATTAERKASRSMVECRFDQPEAATARRSRSTVSIALVEAVAI